MEIDEFFIAYILTYLCRRKEYSREPRQIR